MVYEGYVDDYGVNQIHPDMIQAAGAEDEPPWRTDPTFVDLVKAIAVRFGDFKGTVDIDQSSRWQASVSMDLGDDRRGPNIVVWLEDGHIHEKAA